MSNKEAIYDYLRGEHTIYSRKRFEEMLNNHPSLKKEFLEEKKIYEMVMTGNIHQQLQKMYDSQKEVSLKSSVSPYLRIAAAIIFIIGVSLLVRYYAQPDTQLFDDYYTPAVGLPTVMGSTENLSFEDAMVEYKMGHYTKAKKAFEMQYQQNPTDTLAFYIGQSAMAEGDDQTASTYFSTIPQNSSYHEDALWYRTLLLIKQSDDADALALLKNTTWSKYKKQADEIMERLHSQAEK